MNWSLSKSVHLANDRIEPADGKRQQKTAREILKRFDRQPGIVLADEVGLGKTYVALAVAVSVAVDPSSAGPVVVMVPPSVGRKWPREWETFQEKCMKDGPEIRASEETIRRGSDFLKLLDDPEDRSHHIIFLSHGALTASLTDPFVRLAIVRRALAGRRSLKGQRRAFPRWAHKVIRGLPEDEALIAALLETPPRQWRRAWNKSGKKEMLDDPVPEAIIEVLPEVDLSALVDACEQLPERKSVYLERRLRSVRAELERAVQAVWRRGLSAANLHLPLLVLDEAHHAKNPGTRLAGLFADAESRDDAELLKGPLAGVFDRMLFLTATPLQLGHRELVEVLRRFDGIRWGGLDRDAYRGRIGRLEKTLDAAQGASLRLDRSWDSLERADLEAVPDTWWKEPGNGDWPEKLRDVAGHISEVRKRTKDSQKLLQPLVIRHSRPEREKRRHVFCGRAILDENDDALRGLEIGGEATLPFLLAARAQALILADEQRGGQRGRRLFAEGLASSFEAYRQTRDGGEDAEVADDGVREEVDGAGGEVEWYLDQIAESLPDEDPRVWAQHPKIKATVSRAIELWKRDEKVLVFCYFRATGRALRAHISREIECIVLDEARAQLGRKAGDDAEVDRAIEARRDRFTGNEPGARAARDSIVEVFAEVVNDEELDSWVEVVLSFLRTRSFLVRHLGLGGSAAAAFKRALHAPDGTGRSLDDRFREFAKFLRMRGESERKELLESLERPIGATGGQDATQQVPNVRLANGEVERSTRERLMLGFNTPFLPDVLIASSVMAEGVDLHLNCRHVLHHDLDWNPSVIEQRIGRIDRLGSLSSETGKPVVVFEPFLEATQDEKMFRVMKDRERWFNVVMGEQMELDEWSTDRLSSRVALPRELAEELTLNLGLRF